MTKILIIQHEVPWGRLESLQESSGVKPCMKTKGMCSGTRNTVFQVQHYLEFRVIFLRIKITRGQLRGLQQHYCQKVSDTWFMYIISLKWFPCEMKKYLHRSAHSQRGAWVKCMLNDLITVNMLRIPAYYWQRKVFITGTLHENALRITYPSMLMDSMVVMCPKECGHVCLLHRVKDNLLGYGH